jgi:hypothetical protein
MVAPLLKNIVQNANNLFRIKSAQNTVHHAAENL